ncbi:MAG: TetR/AcrR family transcriptional regulator [Sandaracinaceae bacterium]
MPTPRQLQAQKTRRRVYECALDVFRREGVGTCKIDDIAKAAGVSRGTFYFHFPTKEHVLLERMRETEEIICDKLDELAEDAPLEQVIAMLNEQLTAIWEPDPELLPEVTSAALHYAATNISDEHATRMRGLLAARFEGAVARGEAMVQLPPTILSDLYLGNTMSALLAWYGNRVLSLRAMLEAVTALFWHGAKGK